MRNRDDGTDRPSHREPRPAFPSAIPVPSPHEPTCNTDRRGPSASKSAAALTFGALGVVYGDIGTSPLYAMKEIFVGPYPLACTQDNVLGILSLLFWSLILVVSFKYLVLVMKVDDRGEGGIMATMALALRAVSDRPRLSAAAMALGISGAALFYGDGVITPAISVLSAVEGLAVPAPALSPLVEPIALAILVSLFILQAKGTAHMAGLFGPIMAVWFLLLAVLGSVDIRRARSTPRRWR
jgi:KUP system potassium uptake protein